MVDRDDGKNNIMIAYMINLLKDFNYARDWERTYLVGEIKKGILFIAGY